MSVPLEKGRKKEKKKQRGSMEGREGRREGGRKEVRKEGRKRKKENKFKHITTYGQLIYHKGNSNTKKGKGFVFLITAIRKTGYLQAKEGM
jgi:hypothetical protein